MKQCRKCSVVKPYEQFSKCSKTNDGLQSYCKQCAKANTLKWQNDNRKRYRKVVNKACQKFRVKNGMGVYGLWNNIEQCYDYVGEGQLMNREKYHKSASGPATPWQVKLNTWLDGWDNVYEFRVLCECKTKEQCKDLETEYIAKLNPRYNRRKRQHKIEV